MIYVFSQQHMVNIFHVSNDLHDYHFNNCITVYPVDICGTISLYQNAA